MKIGYSAWGFIGDGIEDSPDGGRLTRALFIEHLIKTNYEVIWLQQNRDIDKNNEPLFDINKSYDDDQKNTLCKINYNDKFPKLDVLFIEWRWKIHDRNTSVDISSKYYTPDYDRQLELLSYYSSNNTKIIIWDKDEKIEKDDYKLFTFNVDNSIQILSPAVYPIKDNEYPRKTLLFPCDLDKIKNTKVNTEIRYLLGYVGSQYERDEQIYKYINPFSCHFPNNTIFAGNWLKYPELKKRNLVNFPRITFVDRVLPKDMGRIYNRCLASVLLCKKNYAEHCHITQRIHEVAANGVIAIGLSEQKGIENFVDGSLIISDAYDLIEVIEYIYRKSINDRQILLDNNINKLEPFDIKNVMSEFNNILRCMNLK